mgnify:CR=1 FL=1
MTVTNPFDFFLEPRGRDLCPFAYDPRSPRRSRRSASWNRRARCSRRGSPRSTAGQAAHRRFPRRPQRAPAEGDRLHRAPGARRADLRADASSSPRARAATPAGCWSPSCATSASPRASSPGYLIQLMPDEKPLDGPEGPTHDFTDLHAWCEVYLPGAGWIGLDPTSGLLTGEGHIPLACTPEPSSAAPIEGAVEQAEVEFSLRHDGDARQRDAAHHQALHRRAVEALLERRRRRSSATSPAHDLRLTMGGEPTFVSVDDMDGAEWNTLALGPRSGGWRGVLFRKLADRFAKGAAAAFRPGQMVSRRAAAALGARLLLAQGRRADLARPASRRRSNPSRPAPRPRSAQRFALAFAERLQLDPGYLFQAFEDTWYYLWRERRLPSNVAVDDAKVKDALERERLARVFEQGLESSVGTVLPHRSAHGDQTAWRPLEERPVVPALGEVLPDPRRSRRWATACRSTRCRGRRRRIPTSSSSPIRWSPIPTCRRSTPSAARRCCAARNAGCLPSDQRQRRGRAARPGEPRAGARSRATARRRHHRPPAMVRTRHCLRAARRPPLRLHAAGRAHRGLSRSRRRGRGHRRGTRPAGLHRRLSAARRRSAAAAISASRPIPA